MPLPAVSTSTSDVFVMPGAPRNRPFPLPGFGLALGITILPLLRRKDLAVFHSSKFHLDEVDESYPEHLRAALGISLRLAAASAACALHAVIPGLCTRSASGRVAEVHAHLTARSDSSDKDLDGFSRPRHVKIGSS